MRPGWDPTKRNRKIGTAGQGLGHDNRMVIPDRWRDDRVYYERLNNPVAVLRTIGEIGLTFLVEPTRTAYCHACTIDDIVHVVKRIPSRDLEELDLIILRQPTRKEETLEPVWGRLVYFANTGRYCGPAVYLNSRRPLDPITWKKSIGRPEARELERLRDDGHTIKLGKRHYLLETTLESTRATQLYRTLAHEIGHLVDPLPYDRSFREKEESAHRYGDEFRARLVSEGVIPFPRIFDEERMRCEGLDPAWFREH